VLALEAQLADDLTAANAFFGLHVLHFLRLLPKVIQLALQLALLIVQPPYLPIDPHHVGPDFCLSIHLLSRVFLGLFALLLFVLIIPRTLLFVPDCH
jgi:hypothetical protein